MTPKPLIWSHKGWDFKKQGKKYIVFQCSMKFSLVANLVLKWVCLIHFFLECLQLIITFAMCTIAINVLDLCAFNPKFQYLIPLFNKISWLCKHQPRRDETSNEGAIQAQQNMTFWITLLGFAPTRLGCDKFLALGFWVWTKSSLGFFSFLLAARSFCFRRHGDKESCRMEMRWCLVALKHWCCFLLFGVYARRRMMVWQRSC
jgi:hypothetical protein